MKHRSDNNREMPPGEKINATTFDRRKFMASVGLMAGALAAPALLQNRVQANESGANHGLPGTNSISKKPKPSVGIEWYNVKDYQVKGDGQTNDAPALLNLLKGLTSHEAATIYFPVGHYVLKENMTFPENVHLLFDYGAMLKPEGDITIDIPVTIDAHMTQVFSGAGKVIGHFGGQAVYPQWWGAKGDKKSDDTAAFQHVFRLSKETDRAITIYVPQGDYVWTDALEVHGHTSVLCETGAIFWRNHTRTMLYNYEYNGTPSPGYSGNGHIVFENARFEFVAYDPSFLCYEDGNVLQFAHASDWVFRNCEFYDVIDAHAIEINSSKNVLIEGCKFYGYRELAQNRWYVEAIQIDHAGTEGIQGALPYDNTHCKHIMIKDCYFGKGRTYTFMKDGKEVTIEFESWPAAIGGHTHKEDHWHENIMIINNTFDRMRYFAVRPYKWLNTLVTGNVFYECGGGIYAVSGSEHQNFGAAQPFKRLSILDNQFIDGQQIYPEHFQGNRRFAIGIYSTAVVSEDVKIEGNIIQVTKDSGMIINNVSRVSIANNVIHDMERNGIEINGCSNLLINQNHIQRISEYGMTLKNCDQITLSNNQIDQTEEDAINIEQGTDLLVHQNMIHLDVDGKSGLVLADETNTGIIRDNIIKGTYLHGLKIEETCYDLAYGYQIGTVQNDSSHVEKIED